MGLRNSTHQIVLNPLGNCAQFMYSVGVIRFLVLI